ncbi:MAG: hypothetical protein K2K84_05410 [Muribaculaceae bacterium]|nr:hypothetical protein [Muribaculaceae bacterium]
MKTNLKTLATAFIVGTALSPAFTACNSSEETTEYIPSNAAVRSFSLTADSKVLPNLDSVYFSIDLFTGEIFNADSLPYGTKTSALVPVILTNGSSVAELSVPRPNQTDTLMNYLENSTDSVDFSNGPVKLRIVSLDGRTERNYTIRVNVHTVPTDTLTWSRLDRGNLPSVFQVVSEQHTAENAGTFYCLTRYENRYSMAVSTDPAGPWDAAEVTLPANARVNTLTATTDGIFILDDSSNLFTSTDNGATWTKTGATMTNMIGAYQKNVIGTKKTGHDWSIVSFPDNKTWALPEGFPVSGASIPVNYRFEMSVSPQMLIVGGRNANGNLVDRSWAFDGDQWADITRSAMPEKLENMAVVPYFNIITDTLSWRVSSRSSVMLAMSGNRADGTPNDTVYLSRDFGMHWSKAPDNLQIPTSVIPSRTNAQAYAYTSKVTARSGRGNISTIWMPVGYSAIRSRATAPITEWEAPYIYLFGGTNAEGTMYNTVYRGAITEFTFKPLQ